MSVPPLPTGENIAPFTGHAVDLPNLMRQISRGSYLTLVRAGDTTFSPPPTIEGADMVSANRILPADCEDIADIALTVLFRGKSGTDTHGMSLILLSPADEVHVFLNRPADA